MTRSKRPRQSSRYLTRRITAAKNVLANPMASDEQRHGARCRLNRAIETLRGLEPVPMMSRETRERLLGAETAEVAA